MVSTIVQTDRDYCISTYNLLGVLFEIKIRVDNARSEQQGIKDEENQVPFWRVGDLKCAKGPVSGKAIFSETDPGGTHFLVAAGDSKVGS